MPPKPKKAAPGGKKKENNPENGGELTPEEKAKMFMLTCQSLQLQLGLLVCYISSLFSSLKTKIKYLLIILLLIKMNICTAERSEDASKAIATKREYQGRVEQIQLDFEEEKKQTFEITQDMTRQYKAMQEELLSRVRKHFLFNFFFY
jgi:sporulation protein YlmC with PRC-barrel domain